MAVRYSIIAKPVEGPITADTMKVSTGITYQSVIVGNAVAVPSGNYATVLQSLVNKTVQPSAAQLAGLLGYMTAIEAEEDTSDVETAIAAI